MSFNRIGRAGSIYKNLWPLALGEFQLFFVAAQGFIWMHVQ